MILPPTKPIEDAALTPKAADALFSAAARSPLSGEGDRRLAIVDLQGGIVYATAAALELFEAETLAELQNRLTAGEGPSARRLRHLATTLPVGGPPRLERMRLSLGRRSIGVNLLCARVEAPGGAAFLVLSTPFSAAAADSSTNPEFPGAAPSPTIASNQGQTPQKSRFLWTVDEQSRFRSEDPLLAAALGANAPRREETLEQLRLRVDLVNGAEFARALEKRETFSDLAVVWPMVDQDRGIEVVLSGAPAYDRRRDFAGYRGFGVLGETVSLSNLGRSGLVAPDRPTAEVPPSDSALDETELSNVASGVGADAESATTAEPSLAQANADEPPTRSGDEAAAKTHNLATDEVAPSEDAAAPTASLPPEEADGSESIPALPESAQAEDSNAPEVPVPETRPSEAASGGDLAAAVLSFGHGAPHERTAEIYVLRQTTAPSSPAKIFPIRPGALEAAMPPDSPHGTGADSVELTKSERDAFREIARALVGRTPAQRQDRASDAATVADAPHESDEAFGPRPVENEPRLPAADSADRVLRNAAGVLDRLPIGILVARDARALYLNHTLLVLLGYSDFEHFQAADGFAAMFADHSPHVIPADAGGVLSIVRVDGQSLAVDGHAQAIVWDGAPATLIALRRSLEPDVKPKLDESQRDPGARNGPANELQQMLDHSTDGAVTLDSAGRILSLNRSAERLFGYEQGEIASESVLMLLAPQSHPETTAKLESLSRASESAFGPPLSVVGRRRNGTTLTLALILGRIGSPETSHYCALVRDLSHERETERRLEAARDAALAASSAKTDFLAQVSHEIRTPLHAILGFSEVMIEERFGPIGNERYKDYLKDIHASAKHVTSLADDLLDLSKIESGKLELAFAPVDANSVIRECVSLMQPQAARERIIMRVSLLEHLPRVMVDERSLRQIMLNLMSNAVKFNEPGGQVIVSTAVDAAGQAVIRVRDTGVGMNENEIGLALEPFGRIVRQDRKGGAGLGLPLTKALVEANKAEFSIKSRREQGTLIEIAFPTIQAAQ